MRLARAGDPGFAGQHRIVAQLPKSSGAQPASAMMAPRSRCGAAGHTLFVPGGEQRDGAGLTMARDTLQIPRLETDAPYPARTLRRRFRGLCRLSGRRRANPLSWRAIQPTIRPFRRAGSALIGALALATAMAAGCWKSEQAARPLAWWAPTIPKRVAGARNRLDRCFPAPVARVLPSRPPARPDHYAWTNTSLAVRMHFGDQPGRSPRLCTRSTALAKLSYGRKARWCGLSARRWPIGIASTIWRHPEPGGSAHGEAHRP